MISKPNPWKRILRIVVILFVILAVLYLGICTYAVTEVTKIAPEYRNKPHEPTPSEFGKVYEDVRFPARNDGLEIAGWYIPNEGSSSTIILVHGRHENMATAWEGTFPKFAASLHDAGFAVLMLDVRGHGYSAEARYDFGLKAKNDVLGAVDWLMAKGFAPGNIGALGVSLGGGAVNYAAAEEPAIGVVVTDSTYSDLNPIIEALWQDESGLPNFFLPGVYLMHQILYRFDLRDAIPINAIKDMEPRPVLVVHCKIDQDVPFSQAEDLVEVIPNAEHWYIDDGCQHAQIYSVMPEAYEATVIPFFEKNLP
jgi:dipeptidyl aminopeptidase/acylaminoacyl peptidase